MDVSVHNHLRRDSCAVGVDFGTLSGRAVVVRAADGAELGTAVHEYRHGVMDESLARTGEPLPPDWALQDPEDYMDVLRHAVPAAVAAAGIDPAQVIGIGTDFTACTVLPVLADGTPLCRLPQLAGSSARVREAVEASCGQPQADRINALAHERGEPWLARYGGRISAEWQFAKALQLLEEDPEIYRSADRWIEAADWIVWQLTGSRRATRAPPGTRASSRTAATRARSTWRRSTRASPASPTDKLAHRSRRSAAGPDR